MAGMARFVSQNLPDITLCAVQTA